MDNERIYILLSEEAASGNPHDADILDDDCADLPSAIAAARCLGCIVFIYSFETDGNAVTDPRPEAVVDEWGDVSYL